VVVRCARRAVAEGPGNGSRDCAAARACGARKLRSSARRRRGREPRQAVLQRRRRCERRGALRRGTAAAKAKREHLRGSREVASSVLAHRAASRHADRDEDLAENPHRRPRREAPHRGDAAASPRRRAGAEGAGLVKGERSSPRSGRRPWTRSTPKATRSPVRPGPRPSRTGSSSLALRASLTASGPERVVSDIAEPIRSPRRRCRRGISTTTRSSSCFLPFAAALVGPVLVVVLVFSFVVVDLARGARRAGRATARPHARRVTRRQLPRRLCRRRDGPARRVRPRCTRRDGHWPPRRAGGRRPLAGRAAGPEPPCAVFGVGRSSARPQGARCAPRRAGSRPLAAAPRGR